jgi:tetratricopeptide (TPR) repeat protein
MSASTDLTELLGLRGPYQPMLQGLAEIAYFWHYMGQHEKAQSVFEAVKILAPDDPVGHLGAAEVSLAQKQYRQAERSAKQATRCGNSSPSAAAFANVLIGDAMIGLKKGRDAVKAWQQASETDDQGQIAQVAKQRLEQAQQMGLDH